MTVPSGAPLAGMRIVELAGFVAVPLGGMTLASLGAEVIRVDPIGGGPDRGRWPADPSGNSLYWAGLNQGKKSVTVDLRAPEGRELVAELAAAAGIVLTNTHPRPGLSPVDLRGRRPDLIHVQLTGRRDGSTAVDYTVNAECGFPGITGPAELDAPVNHVLPAWDIATGLYLAVGLLAAERQRDRTGEPQTLRVALGDVALATAGHLGYLAEAQLTETPRGRIGNDIYGDFGRDFVAADGERFMLLVLTSRHWDDLLTVTGLDAPVREFAKAMGADFAQPAERYRYRQALAGMLADWFAARTGAEVHATLGRSSALWGRYRTFGDLVSSGSLAANPLMSRVNQPGISSYLSPGSPLLFDEVQRPARPAPTLGEHTDSVLSGVLDLPGAKLDDLRRRGVIGTAIAP